MSALGIDEIKKWAVLRGPNLRVEIQATSLVGKLQHCHGRKLCNFQQQFLATEKKNAESPDQFSPQKRHQLPTWTKQGQPQQTVRNLALKMLHASEVARAEVWELDAACSLPRTASADEKHLILTSTSRLGIFCCHHQKTNWWTGAWTAVWVSGTDTDPNYSPPQLPIAKTHRKVSAGKSGG